MYQGPIEVGQKYKTGRGEGRTITAVGEQYALSLRDHTKAECCCSLSSIRDQWTLTHHADGKPVAEANAEPDVVWYPIRREPGSSLMFFDHDRGMFRSCDMLAYQGRIRLGFRYPGSDVVWTCGPVLWRDEAGDYWQDGKRDNGIPVLASHVGYIDPEDFG